MDPVFALQWPEYVVCDRLQKLCPKSKGYSVYIPVSRQEKGVDIGLLHRTKNARRLITIQVKSSRTYPGTPAKKEDIVRYKYYTWFNRFDPSPDADYFALIGFFPRESDQTTKIGPSWYHDCTLLFSFKEMKDLIENCKTVRGKPDGKFGFGFNDLKSIIYTRGDQNRSNKNFSEYIIDERIKKIHTG